MIIVLKPNDQMGKNKKDAPAGYVVRGMDVLQQLFKCKISDLGNEPSLSPPAAAAWVDGVIVLVC